MMLSPKCAQYLQCLKDTILKTGGTLTYEEEINSIIKQEAVPGYQLTKAVTLANWTRNLGEHELERIAEAVSKRDINADCNVARVRGRSSSASGFSTDSRASSYDPRDRRRRARRDEKPKSEGRFRSWRSGRDNGRRRGYDSSASSRPSSAASSRYSDSSPGRSRSMSRSSSVHSAYSTDASSGRENMPCYACGEMGHMFRDCSKYKGKITKETCSKCNKGRHLPTECKIARVGRRKESNRPKSRERSRGKPVKSYKADADKKDRKHRAKAYKSDIEKGDRGQSSASKTERYRRSGSTRRTAKSYKTDVDKRRRRRSQSGDRSPSPHARQRTRDSKRTGKSSGKR